MELRVNVPDQLVDQARAQGIQPEVYAERILAQQLQARGPNVSKERSQEEVREWLDSLAQFSEKIPPLPETISREWLYQDHD
jgi:post-segregation antitoxin (ccd killing protein)